MATFFKIAARSRRPGSVIASSCRLVAVVLLLLLLLLGCCPRTVMAGKDKETTAPIIGGGGGVGVFPPSFAPGPGGGGGGDDDDWVPPPPPEGGNTTDEPTAAPSLRPPTPAKEVGGGGGGQPTDGAGGSDVDGPYYYAVALPQMHLTFTVVDVDSPTVTAAQSTATTSFDSSSTTASGATANNNGSSSSTSANASSLPRGSLLLSTLEDFLQDFLKQSASQHRDALVRVDLNVTDWQDEATTTPNLNGSRVWAVDCQGQAVFVAAANASSDASAATTTDTSTTSTTPTSDDLTKAIITYFSFWGLSELQTYLYEHAQWTVASVSVAVNGDVVQPASGTTGGGDGTDDANDSGPSSSQDAAAAASATHKRNVAIAAVVSVVAVLLVAGALWIVVRRRCQGRRKSSTTDRHNNHNKRIDLDSDHGYGADGYIDNDDDDGLTHESHSPQHSHDVGNRYDYSPPFKSLNPNLPLRIVGPASGSPSRDSTGSTTPPFAAIPDDLMSYSGIVSVEDSVFTSAAGTSASNSPDRPFAYDARRLDHVILSARGFTERHEREELQQQQQQEQSLQRQRSVGGSTAPGDAASAATSI